MLDVWIPHLPPSSNKIYVTIPRKGRFLSKEAQVFRANAMREIQQGGRLVLLQLKENIPYELQLIIFFEMVENKGFHEGKARQLFKRMDLSNRVKLIEDTVSDALALDDCHNFRVILEKQCDPKNTGILVRLRPISRQEVGLTKEEYDRLHKVQSHRASDLVSPQKNLRRSPRTSKGQPHRLARGPTI
jgi:Holliday junction resolvase RusA-like endonuclease